MCGKGMSQTSQQMSAPNPAAMAAYNQAMGQISAATSKPFQKYSSDPNAYISPLTGTQTGAISNITGMRGMTDPYYQAATGLTAAGAGPVGRLTGAQIGEYMNPYMSQVVDPVRAAMNQQFGQQASQQQAEAIKAGAFGGSRSDVARALMQGQQGLAMGQALSPLYQQGYGQALQTAQGQQAIEAQNLQRMLMAGQQFGGLGTAAQQAALQQAQAQLQGGTLEQQTATARLQALYNEFQKQRMYPLQAAQIMAQGAAGLGPLMGSYQTGYQPQPFFGGLFAEGGEVEGYHGGLGKARMGGAVHEEGDYARGGYADGGYPGDLSGLVEQQRVSLGLGAPHEDIQVPIMNIPAGRAPEMGPLPQRQKGLLEKGLGAIASDPGAAYKKAEDIGSSMKTGLKFLTGGPGSLAGFAAGGDVEDTAMQQMTSQPIQASKPLTPESPPEKQKSPMSGLMKAGLSLGANVLLPGSGPFVSAGLGALGMAAGGRAGYATDGAVDPAEDYMARTMVREAAGEGPEGMRAVGHVIANRLAAGRYGKDIQSIVTAPKQFSPWNAEARGTRADPRLVDPASSSYQTALGLARQIRGGESEDPTGGATHFYNPDLANPKWGRGMQDALTIGHHKFGRADAGASPGGVDAARAGIADMRREIPPGDPRRSYMGVSEGPAGVVPASSTKDYHVPDKSFLERTQEHPESLILPVLQGLGAMAGSKSRYLGSAVLEGLGAGAGSYMDMAGKQAEIDKRRQETETEAQESRAKGFLGTKIGEEVGEVQARTAAEVAKIAADPVIKGPDGQILGFRVYMPGSNYPIPVSAEEYFQNPGKYLLAPAGGPGPSMTPPAGVGAPPPAATPGEAREAVKTPSATAEALPAGAPEEDRDLKELAKKYQQAATGQGREWFSSYKDIYTPQQERAEGARDMRTQLLPMAGALASLPKKGELSGGPLQTVIAPVVNRVNEIARIVGFKEPFSPEIAAAGEEANKYFSRLRAQATANNDMRAVAALDAISSGYPSTLNSPKAVSKLLAGMFVENQKEIEKNNFFQKFKNLAESGMLGRQIAPLRSGAWADLGTKFDKNRAPQMQKDKEALARIFYESPALDEKHTKFLDNEGRETNDPDKATTWGAWIIKNAASMTPEQKQFIAKNFGQNVLSYFGM